MDLLFQTLSLLSALIILVSNVFSSQIYQYFHFQQNTQLLVDSTKFYAFFSLMMVGRYLKYKHKPTKINRLVDEGKLLSTAIYIITPFITVTFIYLISQDPVKFRDDLLSFILGFVPVCLSLGVATNHAAHIVSRNTKNTSYLFIVFCILLFLLSTVGDFGLLGDRLALVRYTEYLLLIITYSLVYLPNFWNKDKTIH